MHACTYIDQGFYNLSMHMHTYKYRTSFLLKRVEWSGVEWGGVAGLEHRITRFRYAAAGLQENAHKVDHPLSTESTTF